MNITIVLLCFAVIQLFLKIPQWIHDRSNVIMCDKLKRLSASPVKPLWLLAMQQNGTRTTRGTIRRDENHWIYTVNITETPVILILCNYLLWTYY